VKGEIPAFRQLDIVLVSASFPYAIVTQCWLFFPLFSFDFSFPSITFFQKSPLPFASCPLKLFLSLRHPSLFVPPCPSFLFSPPWSQVFFENSSSFLFCLGTVATPSWFRTFPFRFLFLRPPVFPSSVVIRPFFCGFFFHTLWVFCSPLRTNVPTAPLFFTIFFYVDVYKLLVIVLFFPALSLLPVLVVFDLWYVHLLTVPPLSSPPFGIFLLHGSSWFFLLSCSSHCWSSLQLSFERLPPPSLCPFPLQSGGSFSLK